MARACVLPWRYYPDELPACFQYELDRAASLARDEYPDYLSISSQVDELFDSDSPPVSDVLLIQIAKMGAVERYFSLVMALFAADLEAEWLRQEIDYAGRLMGEERRAQRGD